MDLSPLKFSTYSGYQPSLKTANAYQNKPFEKFSELGYAVAGVNMRGSGCSGGAFDFMEPLTWLDGYDVVEVFAAQQKNQRGHSTFMTK